MAGACDLVLSLQAGELSIKLDPYIRTQRRDRAEESAETRIWPLIKYVEVTLPKSALIPAGVVLVDIPGTGDFNSKRDEMWKKVTLFHRASIPLPTIPLPFISNKEFSALSDFVRSLRLNSTFYVLEWSRAGRVAQVVDCLPSKCEALSLNPHTIKQKF
jgi:hypothetical protein